MAIAHALGLSRKPFVAGCARESFQNANLNLEDTAMSASSIIICASAGAKGVITPLKLFRETRTRGFRGGRQMIPPHVTVGGWQNYHANQTFKVLGPKDIAILICKRPSTGLLNNKRFWSASLPPIPTFHDVRGSPFARDVSFSSISPKSSRKIRAQCCWFQ